MTLPDTCASSSAMARTCPCIASRANAIDAFRSAGREARGAVEILISTFIISAYGLIDLVAKYIFLLVL